MGSVFVSKKEIENRKEEIGKLETQIKMYNEHITRLDIEYEEKKKQLAEITKKIDDLKYEANNIIQNLQQKQKTMSKTTIEYIDNLNGLEFEDYIADLLKKLGYVNVVKTPASGDFGIDVIAEKDNIKYAIQCKNYSNVLGNKCVQEAFSGKQFYNCHVGIVITNSTFTKHAKEQAEKNGILLWDRKKLIELLGQLKTDNEEIPNNISTSYQISSNITTDSEEKLYKEVVKFAIANKNVSPIIIQKNFRIDYYLAAKMYNMMKERGIMEINNIVTLTEEVQNNRNSSYRNRRGIKYCKYCGNEMPKTADLCFNCGKLN